MLFNQWHVLIVDDEPDVLAVSKLMLRNANVYGLPVKVHLANSKADAIELLHNTFHIPGIPDGMLAVAVIDVVMESDNAGLELCQYIRKEMHNQSAQLFIRTGQPGMAPERTVIDNFDISGYFTKVEMTEQKLYTFVKSGIRQWYSIFYAKLIADLTHAAIVHSTTKLDLINALEVTGETIDSEGRVSGLLFDDGTLLSEQPPQVFNELMAELARFEPTFRTPEGHTLTVNKNRLLVQIQETATTSKFVYAIDGWMEMPEALLDITFKNGLALSTLWKRAR